MKCCGWRSPWCLLDRLTRCKFRRVCDRHDAVITGSETAMAAEYDRKRGYDLPREERIRRYREAGWSS